MGVDKVSARSNTRRTLRRCYTDSIGHVIVSTLATSACGLTRCLQGRKRKEVDKVPQGGPLATRAPNTVPTAPLPFPSVVHNFTAVTRSLGPLLKAASRGSSSSSYAWVRGAQHGGRRSHACGLDYDHKCCARILEHDKRAAPAFSFN